MMRGTLVGRCQKGETPTESQTVGKDGRRIPGLITLAWIAAATGPLGASAFYATRSYTPPFKDSEGRVLPESVASAHFPFLEEPQKFTEEMRKVVQETTGH